MSTSMILSNDIEIFKYYGIVVAEKVYEKLKIYSMVWFINPSIKKLIFKIFRKK